MSVTTLIHETSNYRLYKDSRMGVTWWYRTSDGATTLLNTGMDAEYEEADVRKLVKLINGDALFDYMGDNKHYT